MKKSVIIMLCATLSICSCSTYTGQGTYVGAQVGSVLGSAIGGITDGWRGSDVGTIIGMAGGAIIGGAIGSAKDKAAAQEVRDHYHQIQQQKAMSVDGDAYAYDYDDNDSGFDPNGSGDDRLYDFNGPDYTGDYSASEPVRLSGAESKIESLGSFKINSHLDIRNARFVDDNYDNVLSSGELSKIIFEVVNTSSETLYDLQPTVVETTGNRRIYISPSVHVESLAPGQGIRYTAMVKAGKMRDGMVNFNVSVVQGSKKLSPMSEFTIKTRR